MKKGYSLAGRLLQYGASLLLVQLILGCSQETPEQDAPGNRAATAAPVAAVPVAPAEDAKPVVAFGDSLFAGYNLAQHEGFVPALERGLAAQRINGRRLGEGPGRTAGRR